MSDASDKKRVDSASRIIKGSPNKIYKALVDPEALITWLPPKGMRGEILEFEARAGGPYRISLTYLDADHAVSGKSSEHADVVNGRFRELVPDKQIVQAIEFQSDDPAFAGEMVMTWTLSAFPEGTAVSILCENVPVGIRKEDHDVGLRDSLGNLAEFIE